MRIKFGDTIITGSLEPSYIAALNQGYSSHGRDPGPRTDKRAPHDSPWEASVPINAGVGWVKWSKNFYAAQPLLFELDFDKYFPYNNGNGQPIYNEDNGGQLRDPITGL